MAEDLEKHIEPNAAPVVNKSKEDLDREKVLLEVRLLNKSNTWWHYAFKEVIPPYLPVIVAVLTLYFAYKINLFEVKRSELENRKTLLQIEINEFQTERLTIESQRDSALANVEKIKKQFNEVTIAHQKLLTATKGKRVTGYLLTEDGKQILTEDGHPIEIEEAANMIKKLRKIAADNDDITVDDTTIHINDKFYLPKEKN